MILLLGMGKSNTSIDDFLNSKKIKHLTYDDEFSSSFSLDNVDLIIKSNGIAKHSILDEAVKKNIAIISDLEYYYYHKFNSTLITVTGTNGKTTTVSLLKHIIKDIDLVGNIGQAFFSKINDNDAIVEASSYMLEYTKYYHSKITCFLNIYPNHLDHHASFISYIKAKLKLIKNYQKDDYVIYNYDDLILRRIFENYSMNKIPISINYDTVCHYNNGIWYDEKYSLENFKLLGKHNIYNALASVAIARCYNISQEQIQKGLDTFNGVEHRIEYCGKINNTKVYNDSKSTNVLALQSSLSCFENEKICLICGGKNSNIHNIKDLILPNITVYAYGNNSELISKLINNVHKYNILSEVIDNINFSIYDVILFSPASQSYDQFVNFEERGKTFKQLIQKYINNF